MKIIHNNDIEQITFLDERFYFDTKSEKYYPSVNTILDVYPKGYGYIQWLKDLGSNADEVMQRAGEQGTHVHDGIQQFLLGNEIQWINGEKDNYTLEEWLMILKFIDFYKTYKPKVLAIEESLVSGALGFGGTLDLVCEINGVIWYIDHKSGNAIYKTNKIQGAAYQKLWNEQKDIKIQKLGCLHLRSTTRGPDKTGKCIQGKGWKIHESTESEHLYTLFEHAHEIWKEENPNPQPKNMVYPDRISIEHLEKFEIQEML